MQNKLIILFVILLISTSCDKSTIENPFQGSDISQEDAQEALDFHNDVRNDVGSPDLEWSVELAEYAQEWADYLANENDCTLAHRNTKNMNPKGFGENLYWGIGKEFTALDASKGWYSEIDLYTYTEVTNDNYHETGHYTQMVWKNTTEIGIGVAKCSDGAIIIVANYNPPGNVLGQKPY